jgi:hypothetical protein
MARSIAGKHPYLAILHLPERATVLPGNAHRVLPLFDKASLIEHQDTLRVAQCVGHELMVIPYHRHLIPADITNKSLHPTNRAPLNVERHRLDRLALQLTELTHHIVKEMGAGLAAGKAVVKGGLELPQFLQEPFHITRDDVKSRDGKRWVLDTAIG